MNRKLHDGIVYSVHIATLTNNNKIIRKGSNCSTLHRSLWADLGHFVLTCIQTAVSQLPVKIMTLPLDSVTMIS